MKNRAWLLILVCWLAIPISAIAQVQEIPCIGDIVDGTMEDFESLWGTHDPVNDVLVNHDMLAEPNKITTTMVPWVVGNPCAPLQGQAGFGEGFRIRTTGEPWDQIGLTALGTLLFVDRTFTLNAFDANNQLMGSVTKLFEAGFDQNSYNAGVVFLGLRSDEPIYAFELLADNGNVAWDNVTYHWFGQAGTLGDLNCDGTFNGGDIDPFFLALGDPANYVARFPNCDIMLGDMNCDNRVDGGDIDEFFRCLGAGGCTCP
ncbi:MAG: hypothetical protein IH986_09740 [Planctomycetes bacterium]|nr:hypothetical protein [Planctomycetota bacterium]